VTFLNFWIIKSGYIGPYFLQISRLQGYGIKVQGYGHQINNQSYNKSEYKGVCGRRGF